MREKPALRAYAAADEAWLREHSEGIGGIRVISRGKVHDLRMLPGFVAWDGDERTGFAFYELLDGECELVAIEVVRQWRGIGTALLGAVEDAARAAGCTRLWLTTTNDNLDAMRFYQRRGFTFAALHVGMADVARGMKPTIPRIGAYDIPVRDDVEFEKRL